MSRILEIEHEGRRKFIRFNTLQDLEFYMGWKAATFNTMILKGYFPETPYSVSRKDGKRVRLYTPKMLEEVVELTENHYPVYYRGRNVLIKEHYREQLKLYAERVKQLQEKWNTEDYISLEREIIYDNKRRSERRSNPNT